jgi:hypothetical protein
MDMVMVRWGGRKVLVVHVDGVVVVVTTHHRSGAPLAKA